MLALFQRELLEIDRTFPNIIGRRIQKLRIQLLSKKTNPSELHLRHRCNLLLQRRKLRLIVRPVSCILRHVKGHHLQLSHALHDLFNRLQCSILRLKK